MNVLEPSNELGRHHIVRNKELKLARFSPYRKLEEEDAVRMHINNSITKINFKQKKLKFCDGKIFEVIFSP